MNPRYPDITGPEYDPLWAQQAAEQAIPVNPAQYQQAQNVNLGPLRLNGSGVDAASLAVLRAMQNMPQPRGALGGLASGFVSGYAGARASKAQARQEANAAEDKRVAGDNIERRKLAAGYARDLANHRWKMRQDSYANDLAIKRDAAKEALKTPSVDETTTLTRPMWQAAKANGIHIPVERIGQKIKWSELTARKSDKPEGLSDSQYFQRSKAIQSEWTKDRAYQYFQNMQQFYSRAMEEAKTGDNYGDEALIVTLAKAIDDRTGVKVEENRAWQQAQALRDRLKSQFTKVHNGGTLTPESRMSILNQIRLLHQTAGKGYDARREFMRKRAKNLGLDPDIEIDDIRDPSLGIGTAGNANGKAALGEGN
jgi:hypothetical protein